MIDLIHYNNITSDQSKLNGIILLQVNERSITMSELLQAKNENRLIEMFGSGTAAIISPIGSIMYR